jgi:hypothetical protein
MAVRQGIKVAAARQRAGEDKLVPVSRVHLSLTNPRHEPVGSETEAIQSLCNDEFVAELAQDIARRGSLSPLEILGVVPMKGNPGHYIALEGNRRACALIVLADPTRAPARYREQLRRISKQATIPTQLKVHVFPRAEDARQWIELRHLGQQGGIGTRDWNPTQQARAVGENTRTSARANTLALAVLDRLVEKGLLENEERKSVSITTLTRYLGTPGVRAIIGLGSNTELIYTHDADEVDRALLQLVRDSIERQKDGTFKVHSRTDSKQRVAYANKLKAAGQSPTTPIDKPAPPPKASKSDARTATRRSSPHPARRTTLFDRSFAITHRDRALLRLRDEAIRLQVDEFEFSANYLLRALVEQVMMLFAKSRGKWRDRLTDQALTHVCAEELAKIGAPGRVLKTIRQAAGSAEQPISLQSLGHAAHGGTIPAAKDLKAYADTWEPVLVEMLTAMNPKKSRGK